MNYTTVQVFMPATPFAALCLAATPWTAAPADVFLATATLLVCMSQQFHAWAHMKKSELPAAVDALQVCAHPPIQGVSRLAKLWHVSLCGCALTGVKARRQLQHFVLVPGRQQGALC